jgi:D-threo-aldose 1-dehydrogenase
MYGHGLAEYRMGDTVRDVARASYFLVTKVGRTLHPAEPGSFDTGPWQNTPPMRVEFDYSYDGTMRQVEDSLQRMGTHYLDAVLVHDFRL